MGEFRILLGAKIVALMFIFSFLEAEGAIVNIEDLRPAGQDVGQKGLLDLSFSRSEGNTNLLGLGVQNSLVWVEEVYENMLILNYRYGESGGKANINQGLAHARHVRVLSDQLAWEFFLQAQKDQFKKLSYRVLLGTGARLALYQSDRIMTFLGIGGFQSHERLSESDLIETPMENTFRMNSYLSLRYVMSETSSLASTIYYQPRVDSWEDFHMLWDSSFRAGITESVQVRLTYERLYDSRPPSGVVSADQRYLTGLSYKY